MSRDEGGANRKAAASRASRARRGARSTQSTGGAARGGAGNGRLESADGLDARLEEQQLASRKPLFLWLVVVCGVAAAGLIVAALSTGGTHDRVSLSANVRYTVKVGQVPAVHRAVARAMLDNALLKSLTEGHELFLVEMPAGQVAVCAGSFQSRDSREALDLAARLRNCTRDGRHPFASARVFRYAPPQTQ